MDLQEPSTLTRDRLFKTLLADLKSPKMDQKSEVWIKNEKFEPEPKAHIDIRIAIIAITAAN